MSTSVKTTISMKEELFKEVKRLAGELNVSKSKLFVMAVQDYIKKNESQKERQKQQKKIERRRK